MAWSTPTSFELYLLLYLGLPLVPATGLALSFEGIWQGLVGASPPEKPEYLPAQARPDPLPGATSAPAKRASAQGLDFSGDAVGAAPASVTPVVGNWLVGTDGDNPVLVVDGRAWSRGQPAAILFDLKPNGDYYAVRANSLEDNLVLWQFKQGRRGSVSWIKNTPTPTGQWHELKVEVRGTTVKSWLDGKLRLTHDLPQPVAGRVGLWSKADSVVYFDDIQVTL